MSEHSASETVPIRGLYESADELLEAIRRLPNDVMVTALSEIALATNEGNSRRVSQLSLALIATARLQQNDDYRLGVKQVERADEEAPPAEIDRRARFAALRAV